MLVFASLIYYAEFTDPTDTFATIPIGFWWSIVTMTTVGYGDKYPVTVGGYIIGSMCAVIGRIKIAIALVAELPETLNNMLDMFCVMGIYVALTIINPQCKR